MSDYEDGCVHSNLGQPVGLNTQLYILCGPGSSVGIATGYGLDGPGKMYISVYIMLLFKFKPQCNTVLLIWDTFIYGDIDDIYLTAIGLTPGGSSTHLHTNGTQNTENRTYITIKKLGTYITIKKFKTNLGSVGRAPSLRVIPWHLPYD
jgi:hypothetical protein